jgi:hypothetical protein
MNLERSKMPNRAGGQHRKEFEYNWPDHVEHLTRDRRAGTLIRLFAGDAEQWGRIGGQLGVVEARRAGASELGESVRPPSHDITESALPPAWSSAVIIASVHCRRCGYDLRGLRADGRCPECGLEIQQSILHTIDPTASRLPQLRNPAAVGDALVVLTSSMLAGTLLLVSKPLGSVIDEWDPRGLGQFQRLIPKSLWLTFGVIAAVGLWAVWRLAPPPRSKGPNGAIWRDLGLIASGLLGWAIGSSLLVDLSNSVDAMDRAHGRAILVLHALTCVMAVIGLIGLRGVLGVIGRRSREYRRSRSGRQGVEALTAAIAGTLMGATVYYLSQWRILSRDVGMMIGSVIFWISMFMLLIGLVYMVINAWWIRQALRKPPPPMDEVLLPVMPPDTWIPDREE